LECGEIYFDRADTVASVASRLNTPTISVLIPTYNYARYLPEAIESVLEQDFKDFELIIVDDCSKDNTVEVVKAYAARDSRIRFSVNEKNLGIVGNWNHCMNLARADYVKFLFGDDKLCDPKALTKMYALFAKCPRATLAASARVILDDKSNVTEIWRTLPDGCYDGREVIQRFLMENGRNFVGEPSAVMFRKSDLDRVFDPRFLQMMDIEMWFYLLEKGALAYTSEALCAFRFHPQQQTARNANAGIGEREHVLFYADYATRESVAKKVVGPNLFYLRRLKKRNGLENDAEVVDCERRLRQRLGSTWWLSYFGFWIWHRVTKPYRNLRSSISKRTIATS
jgi:glycosyltransferase involved in cell wall biosynthesis